MKEILISIFPEYQRIPPIKRIGEAGLFIIALFLYKKEKDQWKI
jgi:hypothetical protein